MSENVVPLAPVKPVIIGWGDLSRMLPVNERTLKRWEEEAGFPPRRRVCGRNYWPYQRVLDWLDRKGLAHDLPDAETQHRTLLEAANTP